jgi:hypothetical protein
MPCADARVFNLRLVIGEGLMYRTLFTLEMHFALFLWECRVQRYEYMIIVVIVGGVDNVGATCNSVCVVLCTTVHRAFLKFASEEMFASCFL